MPKPSEQSRVTGLPKNKQAAWLPWIFALGVLVAAGIAIGLLRGIGSTSPLVAGSTWKRLTDGMVMVYVPEGDFLMGSSNNSGDSDERPQHAVSLDAFWIDKTGVTNAMFQRFVSASGYVTDAEKGGWALVFINNDWEHVSGADWQHPNGPSSSLTGLENYPVIQVSWNDATAYCEWAGVQLPTEAEWEKAARGTDGRIYPWGIDVPTCSLANFWTGSENKCQGRTSLVGNYPSGTSTYGAVDMAGNAWEWVNDWFSDTYYSQSPTSNPPGPASGEKRVLRGGSWLSDAHNVRSANRGRAAPDTRLGDIGFRCARPAK